MTQNIIFNKKKSEKIKIGNSTVETDNSGSKKSMNLQVISSLGYPRRSKLSIRNEKFQVSSKITGTLTLEVGHHCYGFFSSQNSNFRKLLKYGYKYYFKVLVFFPD
jgi:hypothetical protein